MPISYVIDDAQRPRGINIDTPNNTISFANFREPTTCWEEINHLIHENENNTKIKPNKPNKQNNKRCCICGNVNELMNINFDNHNYMSVDLCKRCVQKQKITNCSKCGCLFGEDELNKGYCYNCLFQKNKSKCHNCQKWVDKNQINYIKNSFAYCNDCVQKLDLKIFSCVRCCGVYKYDRYAKDNICISCLNHDLSEVRNYSYKPEPRFFSIINEKDKLYIGVELEMGEVDTPDIVNDFVAEYSNNFFYMKKDTSIPFYGCEIVTQPATLNKHINSNYWRPLLDSAKECGFNADHDHCGVHIHVSKQCLNSDEIANLDCFVNTFDIWKKIARRESHYSAYINKQNDCWGVQTTNRRCALNLSNNNTIEFRIFKGTLNYDYIMAYIEACHAAVNFIRLVNYHDLSNNKEKIKNDFKYYIKNNKYIYLDKYCYEFNIFGE